MRADRQPGGTFPTLVAFLALCLAGTVLLPVHFAVATHCGGGDLVDNDAIVVDVGRSSVFGVKGDVFVNEFPTSQ